MSDALPIRALPRWVREGTFDEEWPEAPQRGDTIQVRVEFTEDLQTGDGEEWSAALLKGRAHQTDETRVMARVTPASKAPPKKLAGLWDVTLARDSEQQPWKLVSMTRRHAR